MWSFRGEKKDGEKEKRSQAIYMFFQVEIAQAGRSLA